MCTPSLFYHAMAPHILSWTTQREQLLSAHWELPQPTHDHSTAATVRLHRARWQLCFCVQLTEEGRWCGKARNPRASHFPVGACFAAPGPVSRHVGQCMRGRSI